MKKKLLYIPSLVIIFLLVITKIILNSNKLEFMSYVYYYIAIINMIYIFGYTIIINRKNVLDVIGYAFLEMILFLIIIFSLYCIIGIDKRINNYIVEKKYPFSFHPDNYGYKYKNIIIRGNEKIKCFVETCN